MAGHKIHSEKNRQLAVALLNSTLMARLGVRTFPADLLDVTWRYSEVVELVELDTEAAMLSRASGIVERRLGDVRLRLDAVEEKC